MNLEGLAGVQVVQKKELGEVLIGFEGRNKYELRDLNDRPLGFAAEQGKGIFGFLMRSLLGHWRSFDVHIFDAQRQLAYRAHHPFRLFFQRLEVFDAAGRPVGALQQRWAFFKKRFDVEDASGRVLLEMRSGFFRIWTFPFFRGDAEVARVEKKWGGVLTEVFTDADRFRLTYGAQLSTVERALLLAAALFVDLQFFEQKAQASSSSSSSSS